MFNNAFYSSFEKWIDNFLFKEQTEYGSKAYAVLWYLGLSKPNLWTTFLLLRWRLSAEKKKIVRASSLINMLIWFDIIDPVKTFLPTQKGNFNEYTANGNGPFWNNIKTFVFVNVFRALEANLIRSINSSLLAGLENVLQVV